ncbi:MAG TPA: DUF2807 domain-containing protein [Caulobacteraceae bacterium]|nr:DUF2807 domain-containing protein [Caulobacteraceae bacterium]
MTRTLVLIAGVSAGLAAFCFILASALGGQELLHGNWHRSWRVHDGSIIVGHDFTPDPDGGGPAETRAIAWSGAEGLDVDIPADITFTQAPAPGKLTITGPKGTVDQIEASGEAIEYRDQPINPQRVKIVMTAPDVRRFSLSGDETLSLSGYSQDDLDIDVSGAGKVTGQGKARTVRLDVSGLGDADLGKLTSKEARVSISGSGHSTVAPTDTADIDISGAGEVVLATRPATVHSDVSGMGRVVEGGTTFR